MVLEKTDWHAVRLHLMSNDGDYAATATAFGLKVRNLHKQAERKGWIPALKRAREANVAAMSSQVAKTAQSLSILSENFKLGVLELAGNALKATKVADVTPKNPQDLLSLTNAAAKAAGWASESQGPAVQVLFANTAIPETSRDVAPDDGGEWSEA